MLIQDVPILVFSVCHISHVAIPTMSLSRFPFLLCVKLYLYVFAWLFTLPPISCAMQTCLLSEDHFSGVSHIELYHGYTSVLRKDLGGFRP